MPTGRELKAKGFEAFLELLYAGLINLNLYTLYHLERLLDMARAHGSVEGRIVGGVIIGLLEERSND